MKPVLPFIAGFRKKAGNELSPVDNQYFTTFTGVYIPSLLTILGLMMYLRLGWVVGNAGILGSISMIMIAFSLTGCTALAMSSIVTNVRLGAGGVFTLVSQSLGLEIGGSIGVPLYLAQGLSAPMYLYGFVEGWNYIFPDHDSFYVSIVSYFVVFVISYVGAKVAFKVQFLVLTIVMLAVGSILFGAISHGGNYQNINEGIQWWGKFEDGNYWKIFSIYFPAATGVLVGSSMSGNLRSPRKSIPKGTLFAWGTALVVFLSLAIWYGLVGSSKSLRGNYYFSIENSIIPQITLAGVMASCFTASLSCMVAAPRILQSMGGYGILPHSQFFKKLARNEPRNAIFFTAMLSFTLLIIFQDINLIAPFVTIFFIIIYFIVNGVLAIEQALNLVSFRPELKLPRVIPLFGSALALFTMFLISPIVGFISIVFIVALYVYINRKRLTSPWETVQSGIFKAFAVWSARKIIMQKEKGNQANITNNTNRRLWQPDILIPIYYDDQEGIQKISKWSQFLYSICSPQGSLHFAYFMKSLLKKSDGQIQQFENFFRRRNLFVTSSNIKTVDLFQELQSTLNILKNSFFNPNSVFFVVDDKNIKEVRKIGSITTENKIAMLLFFPKQDGFKDRNRGRKREIILWVRDQSPNWKISLNLSNLDYGILISYILGKNWQARIRFICVTQTEKNNEKAIAFLENVVELARLGNYVSIEVHCGDFEESIENEKADLNIFGFRDEVNEARLKRINGLVKGSCLFVKDSGDGLESAIV